LPCHGVLVLPARRRRLRGFWACGETVWCSRYMVAMQNCCTQPRDCFRFRKSVATGHAARVASMWHHARHRAHTYHAALLATCALWPSGSPHTSPHVCYSTVTFTHTHTHTHTHTLTHSLNHSLTLTLSLTHSLTRFLLDRMTVCACVQHDKPRIHGCGALPSDIITTTVQPGGEVSHVSTCMMCQRHAQRNAQCWLQ
jgi:hypothetical protein